MIERARVLYRYLLIAPVLLPLVYAGDLMYPMLVPKTLLLRGLGIVAFAAFIYLVANKQPFFWSRLENWRTWIPGALLAVAYLSSFLGSDFYHSFWSTFERGDGLLTLSVCVGYFYLIVLFAEERFTRSLLRATAWVGSIAGAYVVLQWLLVSGGIDLPFMAKVSGRIGGTMGNAAFLAAYLGITFFITRAVLPEYQGTKRTLLAVGSYLQIAGILLAATRGTEVALLAIAVSVLLYQSWRGVGGRRAYARYTLLGLAVLAALCITFRAEIARIPVASVERLASISLTDSTVSSRLFLWKSLLPETLKTPILGVGAEHIATIFNRVYDPTAIGEEWFDHSHNAYLDYVLQFGILGLALYLAILGIGIFSSWQLASSSSGIWRSGKLIMLAFVVYALQNIFVFDTSVTLWLLLMLLAVALAGVLRGEAWALPVPGHASWAGAVLAGALLVLLVPVVITPLRANLLAFDAYLYHVADVARTKASTDAGLALGTYADIEFGYNAYFMYTNEQLTMLKGADLNLAWQTAYEVLRANYQRYSYDARTATYLLHILDNAPPGVVVDTDFEQVALVRTIELSPKRPQAWYMVTNLALSEANAYPAGSRERILGYNKAREVLGHYITLVPTLAEPHFVLAQLELATGNAEAAAAQAALGKQYYKENLQTARRAVGYYGSILDLPNAAFFLREVVRLDPRDAAAESDLAQLEAYEQSQK